jgi:hypothetical protein
LINYLIEDSVAMGRVEIQEVPEYLQATYRMLECGFPEGIKFGDADYFPLLGALLEGMNFRGVATIISLFTDRDYSMALHDVYSVAAPDVEVPRPEDVVRIKQRLAPCGYEQWVRENEV